MHRKFLYAMLIFTMILINVACTKEKIQSFSSEEIVDEAPAEDDAVKGIIYVHVCGAVMKEGVYELPVGSRVYQAIEIAGGLRTDAAVTQINQAEVLNDETMIYVPTVKEMEQRKLTDDRKVNLNTASQEELMTLTGVGEAKAKQIIQYRQSHGTFQTIEDIMNIPGIKEGLFEKIKEDITV